MARRMAPPAEALATDVPRARIAVASMVGTTIEFYDFYVYATAAVSVFPKLFFPASDPVSATLASLASTAFASICIAPAVLIRVPPSISTVLLLPT